MLKPIIWSPLAESDFDQILEYLYHKWNQQVTIQFIEITEKVIQKVAAKPKLFPVINKEEKIRKCVITKHNTLFYRETKTQIEILRIYDTRQDPDKLSFGSECFGSAQHK